MPSSFNGTLMGLIETDSLGSFYQVLAKSAKLIFAEAAKKIRLVVIPSLRPSRLQLKTTFIVILQYIGLLNSIVDLKQYPLRLNAFQPQRAQCLFAENTEVFATNGTNEH